MHFKLKLRSELGNIWTMSSDQSKRILQRPLISLAPGELRPISSSPCQHLQSQDPGRMGSEISESGWTMYLDQSLDSWAHDNATSQFDTEQLQNKEFQYVENVEGYPNYDYPASSITGNEEDSSMASDASSGPQKLPLPLNVEDIEFEQDQQAVGSYSLVSKRKRGACDKNEDLECMASCSSMNVNFTRRNVRKLGKKEDDYELSLLLQDTASSPVHRKEGGFLEREVNMEQTLQLRPVESLDDSQDDNEEVNTRFQVLRSLLPDGAKIGRGKVWRRH